MQKRKANGDGAVDEPTSVVDQKTKKTKASTDQKEPVAAAASVVASAVPNCTPPLMALGCCVPQPSCVLPALSDDARTLAVAKSVEARAAIDAALKSPELLNTLRDDALAWSAAYGLTVAASPPHMVHAPCTLLPTFFPRDAFSFAYSVSEDLNELVDRLSHDTQFLTQTLGGVCKVDPFYARLFDIFTTAQKAGVVQPISLGINRSDYMLEPADGSGGGGSSGGGSGGDVPLRLKQVELNTISAAGSAMSHNTARLHRYLMARHFPEHYDPASSTENNVPYCLTRALAIAAHLHPALQQYTRDPANPCTCSNPMTCIIASTATADVSDASGCTGCGAANNKLKSASSALAVSTGCGNVSCAPRPGSSGSGGAAKAFTSENVAILMVVQGEEKNIIDQKIIEFMLFTEHGLPLMRRTLAQIAASAKIDPKTKDLIIDGKTILVTYFRAGYTPKDYPTDNEWSARLVIEQSRSIKCPTVAYQLCGSKKVQQTVAAAGVLEKYVSEAAAKRIRHCYTGLWPLDNTEKDTEAIIAKAIADPDSFVLKPQREGGGNNVWGSELAKVLKTASVVDRGAYILMQRIKSVSHVTPFLRNGKVSVERCTSEFGVYSYFIGDGTRIFHNRGCGHLLRTKLANSNEGGVFAGFAVFDSPLVFA